MIVSHVAPAEWADTDEADRVQPSDIAALEHQVTLEAADIAAIAGQIPAGPAGPQGPQGEQGPAGPAGSGSGGAGMTWGGYVTLVLYGEVTLAPRKFYCSDNLASVAVAAIRLPNGSQVGAAEGDEISFCCPKGAGNFTVYGFQVGGPVAGAALPAGGVVRFAYEVDGNKWVRTG